MENLLSETRQLLLQRNQVFQWKRGPLPNRVLCLAAWHQHWNTFAWQLLSANSRACHHKGELQVSVQNVYDNQVWLCMSICFPMWKKDMHHFRNWYHTLICSDTGIASSKPHMQSLEMISVHELEFIRITRQHTTVALSLSSYNS